MFLPLPQQVSWLHESAQGRADIEAGPCVFFFARDKTMTKDENHLGILSTFYYVVAALAGIFSCMPFIHITIGVAMLLGVMDSSTGEAPPAFLGWIFIIVGALVSLMGFAYTVMLILTGRFLKHRRHYTFCLVIAGMSCLFMPFGTVLGIFSIILLSKPELKAMFDHA